jgi:hypothetical protein
MARDPLRKAMTEARKRRIWTRDLGHCWLCAQPVDMLGPDVRYDHRNPLWITRDDSDEGISPAHLTCDAPKTKADQTLIAKIKRIIRKGDPTTRKPARMKSRGFQKDGPKARLQSRPFPKRPEARP